MTDAKSGLGEILVQRGVLNALTAERVTLLAKRMNRRLDLLLEELGLVTGEELAQALALQYGLKVAREIAKYSFSADLLALVPVETAVEQYLFPLRVSEGSLALAVADPTATEVLKRIEKASGLAVTRVVAARQEINRAICRHYLGREYSPGVNRNLVLIVDDDRFIRTSLSAMLEKSGYRVATADNGLTAFNEIVALKPDVVITDKTMPKRDGYQLLESMKHIPDMKDTPVLLITASSSPEDEAEAYDKGFFDFISKPFFSIVIEAKIRRALRARSL